MLGWAAATLKSNRLVPLSTVNTVASAMPSEATATWATPVP